MKRGEVRWYKLGPPDKRRPVVILTRDCAVNCDHIQTVMKSKIGPAIAKLATDKMEQIRLAVAFALDM